jgi:hypothetical protein
MNLKVVQHILGQTHTHKNNAHIITAVTENCMTLSFIYVYISPNMDAYKTFEKYWA